MNLFKKKKKNQHDYLNIPQAGSAQAYVSQSPNSYGAMSSVGQSPPVHGHHQVMHQQHDYLNVPQAGPGQNYASQSPNSYGSLPMASVIQHRMSGNHSNLTTHNPLPSPHQRLGPSPSSCSVGSNFYSQSASVPHSVTPVPTPTPTPSATPTLQQQQQQMNNVGSANGNANWCVFTISI